MKLPENMSKIVGKTYWDSAINTIAMASHRNTRGDIRKDTRLDSLKAGRMQMLSVTMNYEHQTPSF